jgi:CubicO group peptidase (beta-lactamase class C family)
MDSELLAKMIDYIRDNDLNVHSLTVVRHGYIVLDAYFWPFTPLTKHDIASCTKSFTSTLFGIAIDKGYIRNVRVPILKFFKDRRIANPDKNKSKITCEELLTMTSGLECVNEPNEVTLNAMNASADFVQFALDLPVTDEPGSKWAYNSCGSHLLGAIVTGASGLSLEEFGRRFLFDRIGIGQISWPRDPQGYNHGWGDIQMIPRDMAKLGFLFLHDGQWDGEQVVSKRWVRSATANHTKDFGPPDGYGYQWWTYKYGSYQAQGRGGRRRGGKI